jgi:hypothetical protein
VRCLLAPLAFLSPRIIAAIVDGTAPADLTVTGLAKALPDLISTMRQFLTAGIASHPDRCRILARTTFLPQARGELR